MALKKLMVERRPKKKQLIATMMMSVDDDLTSRNVGRVMGGGRRKLLWNVGVEMRKSGRVEEVQDK
jgi:hypothetical protein